MAQQDEGTICALTEQGNLGLGVTKPSDDQERADLKRRLEELEREAARKQQNRR